MLVIFFALTTLAILVTGISLMAFGGKLNEKYSNKLMVLRIVSQALALLSLALLYFTK